MGLAYSTESQSSSGQPSLNIYPAKKKSAQVGVRVNSILTKNGCIKWYMSLFKEIILQQFDAFQTKIQGSLTKLGAFNASRGHPSKWLNYRYCHLELKTWST